MSVQAVTWKKIVEMLAVQFSIDLLGHLVSTLDLPVLRGLSARLLTCVASQG